MILALDLPRVTAPVLLEMVRAWRGLPNPAAGAVIAETRRGVQPLAGVFGSELGAQLRGYLTKGGSRAARDWVQDLGEMVTRIPASHLAGVAGHPDPFLNVNRPAHVERALELPPPAPPLVSVVGWKDSGKTSVAVGMAAELRRRGYRVMALKHGHGFRLDTPGTDSHRLVHEAGVERVLLAGPEDLALLGHWGEGEEEGVTRLAARFLHEADVVVVEGWKRAPLPALEIRNYGSAPRDPLWTDEAPDRDRFIARVLRDPPPGESGGPGGPPAYRSDEPELAAKLADRVEARVIPGLRWIREGGGP